MIILGSSYINHPTFFKIRNIEDIKSSESNSIVVFDYDIDILKYCLDNKVNTAVKIQNITQAIFCNNLYSSFILVNKDIAKDIQKIAQNYMFDSKIAQVIENENEIEEIALNEIDACIYKELV